MQKKLTKKFWLALVIFSLIGQVAWVVENMYFNVFIYNMFNASPDDISLMVSASAVSAAVTTIFMGALSDRLGKRKIFMSAGYILWGISILAFSLVRLDVINALFPMAVSASAVAITIVIILDCLMTFFGSTANDAAFNAWLTDSTDSSNRGSAEGINSMMPLVAILVVFGGFMFTDPKNIEHWTLIFVIIGVVVLLIGILGLFLIKEPEVKREESGYFSNIIYGFLPSTIKKNKELYISLIGFIIFNISIQIFMPYLIIYYEVSLQMSNYVLIMAPAIILASVVTALWGKVYDKKGFTFASIISVAWLMLGYILLFIFKDTVMVFIGSLLMMSGYLSGMAVFGAKIRDNTPIGKAGRLQGVRIVSQVLVPGIIGPYIGKMILKNAEMIKGDDGTMSFVPSAEIFLGSLIVIILVIPFIVWISKSQKPKIQKLKTDYQVDEIPYSEYPRPNFKRDSFINLNGNWDFKVVKGKNEIYNSKILVPFPPESELSGVERITKKGEKLIYSRTFSVDKQYPKTILNFGAVDNFCEVYINKNKVGKNIGGYLPFAFDITNFLVIGENEIAVEVLDELDTNYPYGKQKHKRGGMWYTPISGIWQTVWLENLCLNPITNLKITTTINSVTLNVEGGENQKTILLDGKEYNFNGNTITIDIKNPKHWSPENPYLYNFTILSGEDKVESYFALREVKIEKNKILLNGKPYFFNGVLDQGYFPDGIYLPPNEKGFIDDILTMKKLGFNTLRKHIKIEPLVFYYYCDLYGMAVFQDMLNNGKYSFIFDTALPTIGLKKNKIGKPTTIQKQVFLDTAKKTIELLNNYPSVVYYTIFNEGWGQHDATKIYSELKPLDTSRVWDTASGWFNNCESDVISEHVYFKPINLKESENKPIILSEFGGYSYKILENSFNLSKTYGYKNCTKENFMTELESLYINQVLPQIKKGLAGAIITQVSDIEDETNGIITYDRKVLKVDETKMQEINKALITEFNN